MQCEAMVLLKGARRPMYQMCGAEHAEKHHKLTRARGGAILDAVGETYHIMWLCREHHGVAHDAPAFENGLLIRGKVITGIGGNPVYTGPDEYLLEHYGLSVPS